MDYELEPSRVTRRSSASGFAVAALINLAVVGIVIATSGTPGGSADRRPGAVGSPPGVQAVIIASPPSPSPRPPFLPPPFPTSDANTLPLQLTCHAIDVDRCRLVADAAVAAARDPYLPSAAAVDVWASLVCDSTLDCPPNQLVNLLPLGSATISYRGSEIILWVNVGEIVDRSSPSAAPSSPSPASGGQPVASIPTIDAWVLRPHP
jgi:hypothetical protein